jgi:integrase/recombinase XerC
MAATPHLLSEATASSELQGTRFLDVINSYERYYACGKTHTARAKRLDLQHFAKFLVEFRGYSKAEKLKVRDFDFSAVQRFVDDSLAKGESPATVARRLATIKHMGRTLSEKVAGFINPAREVKPPKIPVQRPQAVPKQELSAIKRKAKERLSRKHSFIRSRNLMLLNFLLDTGIRADEARLLKRGQLDDKLEWVKNVRTKGRRYRNVYITSAVRKSLTKYLEERERELKNFFSKLSKRSDRELPLFISSYGAKAAKPESFMMGAKTLWRAINEFTSEQHLHPHLLRHSYALDLLNHSNDIRLVSQALGHSDVKVTMRYTERKDEEIASALERARLGSKIASNSQGSRRSPANKKNQLD